MDSKAEVQRLEREKWKLLERIYLLREKLEEENSASKENQAFDDFKLKNNLQKLDKLNARIKWEESRETKWLPRQDSVRRTTLMPIEMSNKNITARKGNLSYEARKSSGTAEKFTLPSLTNHLVARPNALRLADHKSHKSGLENTAGREAGKRNGNCVKTSGMRRESNSDPLDSESEQKDSSREGEKMRIVLVPNRRRLALRRRHLYEKQLKFATNYQPSRAQEGIQRNISRARIEAKDYYDFKSAETANSNLKEDARRSFLCTIGALSPKHLNPLAPISGTKDIAPSVFCSRLLGRLENDERKDT